MNTKKMISTILMLAILMLSIGCSSKTDSSESIQPTLLSFKSADINMAEDFSEIICTDNRSGRFLIFGKLDTDEYCGYITDAQFKDKQYFTFTPSENETVRTAALMKYGNTAVLSVSEDDTMIYTYDNECVLRNTFNIGEVLTEDDIYTSIICDEDGFYIDIDHQRLVFIDKDGNIHYEAGKNALSDGETYCILPSYSPENNPKNYPSPSVANAAIDIAACRSNLEMLLAISKEFAPETDTEKWEQMLESLPPYLYDETGALKEWACNSFAENNEHRHLSHLYCVWPLTETQNDEALRTACIQAIENRESENEASHALVHRALIAARLKDSKSLTRAVKTLMNHKIHYDSLMTNHDYDRHSCYCTDFEIGYLGIINESLLYSETGLIEILPAVMLDGFESGEITGLRARTRAVVNSLSWDLNAKTASVTVTSDIAQTITVRCGVTGEKQVLQFAAGEQKTVEFAL